jgi:hypothetical protein
MTKRYFATAKCTDCGKEWEKRTDTFHCWGGRCDCCAKKLRFNTPENKKISRDRLNKTRTMEGFNEKLSKAKKGKSGGKLNNKWKGGITPVNNSLRTSYRNRQWISDVFTRDDFTCQVCDKRGVKLNAHHIETFSSIIKKNKITTTEQGLDCDELWNINNGQTLCYACHRECHFGEN